MRGRWAIIPFAILLFCFWLMDGMIDDWGRLSGGWKNLVTSFNESLWPPDW